MTGDCGDVVASLAGWSAWLLEPAVHAAVGAVWVLIGATGPAPVFNLEEIL